MEIHQIVAAASPGDAVTNAALGFQEILQRIGTSAVFARYVDPRLAGRVFPLPVYEACAGRDDLLIYHASIGEPEVVKFILQCPQRLILVYHNITPAEYFAPHDATFANLLAAGRSELLMLRDRVTMALAVSEYNAAELREVGYQDVRVSPLPVNPQALRDLGPDEPMTTHLRSLDGPLVLFVGQILPHKRPDLLLQAFHLLVTHLLPDASLAMLGPTRLGHYHRALQQQAWELSLPHVILPGWLRVEELVAFYRAAVGVRNHERTRRRVRSVAGGHVLRSACGGSGVCRHSRDDGGCGAAAAVRGKPCPRCRGAGGGPDERCAPGRSRRPGSAAGRGVRPRHRRDDVP